MKLYTTILLFAFSSLSFGVDAACNNNDIYGSWYAKYRFSNPQQVGECAFTIDEESGFSGLCYNVTYGVQFSFFDATWFVKKNCQFKAVADLTDGQRLVLKGKMYRKRALVLGTIKSINNGFLLNGTYKMQKQ